MMEAHAAPATAPQQVNGEALQEEPMETAEHIESSGSMDVESAPMGSHVDQMETLPMDWPPQPQYPKTTLKRWCTPKPAKAW